MKISLNWIREFVDIPAHLSTKELSELLTLRTCEVEGHEEVDETFAGLEGVVVGEIVAFEKIPNTEKLHKALVNIGREKPIQLIFGAMIEMKVGNRVPVAVAPTTLPTGLKIDSKMIRGVLTEGMLCLDQELGLAKEGVSIQYFPGIAPGTPFAKAYKERQAKVLTNVVVGKILELKRHPNADRLNVAQVDLGGAGGTTPLSGGQAGAKTQIVCGGQNLEVGMLVAVALPGAETLADNELMKIKAAKIRGEESNGMICAEEEIGLPKITKHPAEVVIANMTEVCKHFDLPTPKAGTPLADVLAGTAKGNDILLEVDNKSLTHRPDLWGHYGMAREFAAFLGKKLKPFVAKNPTFKATGKDKGAVIKVETQDVTIMKRFLTQAITGIKIEPSPSFLQKRLRALGMRPINNIVDISNYVMLELGYPSHTFDRRTVENDHFVVRFAKNGEELETLDHKKRKLSAEDILVTNGKRALGMAGTMGGLNSEITDDTTEVIVEVGNWDPVLVRKMSQRHSLRTDAATRFEKALDPEIAGVAFHRVVELILNICKGARLAGPATDYYPKPAKPVTIELDIAATQSKIGAPISEKDMTEYLKGLEFGVTKSTKKGFLKVTVPTFRATKDVSIEDDLVEEVARMYGYEKLAPLLPSLPIRLPIPNKERTLKYSVRNILSLGLGFTETSRHSFYGKREIEMTMLTDKSGAPLPAHVTLANPLTQDQTHMRISLLPNLLTAVAANLNMGDSLNFYEIGRTYIKTSEFFPREEKFVCGLIAKKSAAKKKSSNDNETFYEILGVLHTFLKNFHAPKYYVREGQTPPPYAHPSKCAEFACGKDVIAIVYDVHPQVLKNFGIKADCSAFELNFTKLAMLGTQEATYAPLPKFPGIELDVSVLVEKTTPVREILELVKKSGGEFLKTVKLLDTFEDKSLGENKKSLTVRAMLQSDERTLTDEESKQAETTIKASLTHSGFVIR